MSEGNNAPNRSLFDQFVGRRVRMLVNAAQINLIEGVLLAVTDRWLYLDDASLPGAHGTTAAIQSSHVIAIWP